MLSKYADILKELRENKDSSNQSNHLNSRVLIIDSTNSFIRCFSVIPALSDHGDHIGGSLGFLRSIGSAIKRFNPTRVIAVFDGKGGSSKRKQIYSEYKSNRLNPKSFNRPEVFESIEHEQRSMLDQFTKLIQYLRCLPITTIVIDNIEADDVIAYAVTNYFKDKSDNIIIMSDDKDYLQLVNSQVHVWRPVEKQYYTDKDIFEKYGISSYNFLMYKIFQGDNSDNIPGINGIGEKTILNKLDILKENRLISLDDLMSFCENKKEDKKLKLILDQKDDVIRNYKLMQLHDVDISSHNKMLIQDRLDAEINTLNKIIFKQLLMIDGASNYIKDLDFWLTNFHALATFTKK